jgi:hypothetical protein
MPIWRESNRPVHTRADGTGTDTDVPWPHS